RLVAAADHDDEMMLALTGLVHLDSSGNRRGPGLPEARQRRIVVSPQHLRRSAFRDVERVVRVPAAPHAEEQQNALAGGAVYDAAVVAEHLHADVADDSIRLDGCRTVEEQVHLLPEELGRQERPELRAVI